MKIDQQFLPGDKIDLTPRAPLEEKEIGTVVSHVHGDIFEIKFEDGSSRKMVLSKYTKRIDR